MAIKPDNGTIKLVKKDPPSTVGRKSTFWPEVEKLLSTVKENPREWFQIATWTPATGKAQNRGTYGRKLFPQYEWTAAKIGNGEALFVRYVRGK